MKTIYIDSNFKCHISNPDNAYMAVETDAFDGKCDVYIEGYRFVPAGSVWTRSDGMVFTGEMITPWKPWAELDATQREYERELIGQLQSENATLLDTVSSMVEEVYQSDLEMMGG